MAVAVLVAAMACAPVRAEGLTPPHRRPLSCTGSGAPEAEAVCNDPLLSRLHRSNEATEADAGRRHPADAVASRERERDAMEACGRDRECLRKALAKHAEELTLMLSR